MCFPLSIKRKQMEIKFEHKPVMLEEVLTGLNIKPSGIYLDCTQYLRLKSSGV